MKNEIIYFFLFPFFHNQQCWRACQRIIYDSNRKRSDRTGSRHSSYYHLDVVSFRLVVSYQLVFFFNLI